MSTETRRDIFQAIADPNRRQIIDLLLKEPMTLNAIADQFEITRPAVSQHIKHLIECGVVEVEQKGRERYCKLQQAGFSELHEWMDHYDQIKIRFHLRGIVQ